MTAGRDDTAVVWEKSTRKKLAGLAGHRGHVNCVAVNDRIIVTGSLDKTVRIYRNGNRFSVLAVLVGVHESSIDALTLLGDYLLMTASYDRTVAFVSMPDRQDRLVCARVAAGVNITSAAVLIGGKVAVADWTGKLMLFDAPKAVSHAVAAHAADCATSHILDFSVRALRKMWRAQKGLQSAYSCFGPS